MTHCRVLVSGLDREGRAACSLLRARGVTVMALEPTIETPERRKAVKALAEQGVRILHSVEEAAATPIDLAVITSVHRADLPTPSDWRDKGISVISELELAQREALCLQVAVTGTNGKATVCQMVEQILTRAHRRVISNGTGSVPLSELVAQTKDLDFLIVRAEPWQLAAVEFFRPVVAVLTNLAPFQAEHYPKGQDLPRAVHGAFQNQQPFDWAIVQSEALAQLRAVGMDVRSKVITYSARNRRADLYLDRGLLISRLPNWSGPLLDMEKCRIRGLHAAENLMATLAVGHVLRLPLDEMSGVLKSFKGRAHCCERVAIHNGVEFVNDAKSMNVLALEHALQSLPNKGATQPNVILIAGGRDHGLDFHSLGPLLSQRVKEAFLYGEASTLMRAAWGLFTPCTVVGSLLEAVKRSAQLAVSGDVVLFSPACSSSDSPRDFRQQGEAFRQSVSEWVPLDSLQEDLSDEQPDE